MDFTRSARNDVWFSFPSRNHLLVNRTAPFIFGKPQLPRVTRAYGAHNWCCCLLVVAHAPDCPQNCSTESGPTTKLPAACDYGRLAIESVACSFIYYSSILSARYSSTLYKINFSILNLIPCQERLPNYIVSKVNNKKHETEAK
jgi:hypothetical protein